MLGDLADLDEVPRVLTDRALTTSRHICQVEPLSPAVTAMKRSLALNTEDDPGSGRRSDEETRSPLILDAFALVDFHGSQATISDFRWPGSWFRP